MAWGQPLQGRVYLFTLIAKEWNEKSNIKKIAVYC